VVVVNVIANLRFLLMVCRTMKKGDNMNEYSFKLSVNVLLRMCFVCVLAMALLAAMGRLVTSLPQGTDG